MNNIFTKIPKRGDIWLRKIETRQDLFIKLETFVLSEIPSDEYEILGVVYFCNKNGIEVLYKENASKVYFNRCWWYLDGYTIDGSDQSGVISARFSTDNWATNVDKTLTYNATTVEQLIEQLNNAFATDSDFTADDWEASIIDGKIRLTANATWQQFVYTSAKSGFTFTGGAPEFKSTSQVLRKNGQIAGDWAISNMDKAIQYFRADNVGWKPTSPVKTFKSQQPLCLPVYLGTSTAVQGDMCEYVRDIFGEGENGWLNYLHCCEPVWNTQMGVFQVEDGKESTELIGRMRYTSAKTANGTFSPAMDYVLGINTRTLNAGELYMPSTKQLGRIMYGIKYGTSSSRDADILNDALNRINGVGIKNNAIWWSSCRFNSCDAWYSIGGYGIFSGNRFSSSYGVVPVLHLKVA